MLNKARKWASASIGAQLLENMGVSFILGPSYLEEFYEVSQRDADVLLTGISLHRDPLGEPGVDSFAGIFERKDKVYLGSFLGPRGH